MKKMLTSAVMAFVVLAACNTNPATPSTNVEVSKQPAINNQKAKVLGVLEVELSSEQGSISSAKFIETGSTGLSSKGVAVPITSSNWVFTPGTTTYLTDSNFKYLQNTITLENKTGISFSNLAMYALNTSSNIGGTAFSAVKTLAGVALTGTTASDVARAVMPTHGMTNTTTVDPNKADLMLYTPDEAAAVQAQLVAPNFTLSSPTVLEYGFLARNLAAGARAIGTSAAACPSGPTCNKATINWAFKFPLSLPNSSNLGKFTLKYVVVNEPGSFAVQSLEEQTANKVAGQAIGNQPKIRTLFGSQVDTDDVTPLCRARTSITPNRYLGSNSVDSGSVDDCFGTNGLAYITNANFSTVFSPGSLAVQQDGKILVSGSKFNGGQDLDFAVMRYKPNGSPDNSWGVNGFVTTAISDVSKEDYANALAVQPDGKVIAAGYSRMAYNGFDFSLARYTANGSLDFTSTVNFPSSSFGSQTKDQGNSVVIQSDGSILIGGYTSAPYLGVTGDYFGIAKYGSGGSLGNNFGTNGLVNTDLFSNVSNSDYLQTIKIQSDGKIVAAGNSSINGVNSPVLVRYNTNGSIDVSFGVDGTGIVKTTFSGSTDPYLNSMEIQTDGKIVIAGYGIVNGHSKFALARYNSDGTPDSTGFGLNGQVVTNFNDSNDETIRAIAIQKDGKIVAAGGSQGNVRLVRYNANGSVDTTFGSNGKVTSIAGSAIAIAIQKNGKITLNLGNVLSQFNP